MWKLRALLLLTIGLLPFQSAAADERVELRPVSTRQAAKLVKLWSCGELLAQPAWTFAIFHGLKGTQPGDRFHTLAARIKAHAPRANVLLVDWSPTARLERFGMPAVWEVAEKIDAVAEECAAILPELAFDARRATLLGESFGVYVQGRMAIRLGGVERILAFNPASELGGYTPLDLRKAARRSWSFHTYSAFDTLKEIAHGDFFLETAPGADDVAQHTHGVNWLAGRLAAGDGAWLAFDKPLPAAKPGAFLGRARLDGKFEEVVIDRKRPAPREVATSE